MRPLLAAIPAFLAGACHAYAPSSLADVRNGDKVRVLLTPDQRQEFADPLPGTDRVLEGSVVEVDSGRLLLEVPVVTRLEGMHVESLRQRVEIPAAGLADLELRSLARGRTYSMVGIGVAVIGFVLWDQLLSDARRGTKPPPGPPEEDRRVGIRIPFGIR